jgi:hypothetical protein
MNIMPVRATNTPCPILAVILSGAQRSRRTCFSLFCRKGGKPQLSTGLFIGSIFSPALLLLLLCPCAQAQKAAWRQATDAELASLLPARAQVEKEHIETEKRTASGIVNSRGRFIAGVVLLTAGYSAEGKYSHYLMVQTPIHIGGVAFKPGEYVFGWDRAQAGDALNVHFYVAATGAPVGTAEAHRIAGSSRVESLHIWPPEKALIQFGRFGIPYELDKK